MDPDDLRDPYFLARHTYMALPGPELTADLADLLRLFPPAGVVLFRRNVTPSAEQIKRLTGGLQELSVLATGQEMIIAIDQEGSTVKRLPPPFGQYPDAASYGPEGEEAVYTWGLKQGRELKNLGVTMNFAPVADVNTLGQAGIMKARAFGEDPDTVARLVKAAIKGLHEAGISACAKHFPGLGHSRLDSHQDRPMVDKSREELQACELMPFRAAMEAQVEAIMVGHLVYPAFDPDNPASLSRAVVTDLLRDQMGFRGLILSDDLEMGAIVKDLTTQAAAGRALAAGSDAVLICQSLDAYLKLVRA